VKNVEADERARVQEVLCLTGGELEDKPWLTCIPHKFVTFEYWYEGIPEWSVDEYRDLFDVGVSYRTVIYGSLIHPDTRFVDPDDTVWELVGTYVVGPERECPYRGQIVGEEEWRRCWPPEDAHELHSICPLCEAALGSKHGVIYIGEGWRGYIFRSFSPPEEE
jgi:hypothetical protein